MSAIDTTTIPARRRLGRHLMWLWICWAALAAPSRVDARAGVGDPFPVWSLTDLAGTEHQLGGDGQVMLLYFLGSGCSICVDICKRINSDFVQTFSADELAVYAIDSLDGTSDELNRLRNEAGVRFPYLRDGSLLTAECGISWHAILVVDERGKIRYLTEGANPSIYDPAALRELLDQLLGRAADTRKRTWGAIKQLYDGR